jgi:hypothetical protein
MTWKRALEKMVARTIGKIGKAKKPRWRLWSKGPGRARKTRVRMMMMWMMRTTMRRMERTPTS